MKFGGTSVKDKEAIERVVSIVRGRMADKPLVVVSAMAKVTRLLCSIADEAEAQHLEDVDRLMRQLRDIHTITARALLEDYPDTLAESLDSIGSLCDSLQSFVSGVCQIGELSPRSYARIVSTGELLSSTIVAASMSVRGLGCRWLDARKMIITDNEYMSAVPDMQATEANVKRLVQEASKGVSVVLTQGFIASSAEGWPSVLGFEGSDYSAAIFGMALDAERIEIWTDVDGIQSADPDMVQYTRRIGEVSYEEASEMAFLGARVLHPLTIEPARRKNIPVVVLNSKSPDGEGSVVTYKEVEPGPKSIAVKKDIDYLEIRSEKIIGVSAMLAGIFGVVSENKVKVTLSSVSESAAGLTLDSFQPGFESMLTSLRERFNVMVYRDKAEISVVGRDITLCPGIMEAMLKAAGDGIYMTAQSPLRLSASMVIDRSEAESVARRLHKEIFV